MEVVADVGDGMDDPVLGVELDREVLDREDGVGH